MAKKGEGTFSEVLKAQCIKNGKYVAIKCMKNHFDSLDQVNNLREIQALRRLSPHGNIIKLLEVLYDQPTGRLALVFELMDMNIYELIRGRRHYVAEDRIKTYMYQLVKSMDHMHRNGIFHRDIKPENILIMDDCLKLADFGSCRGIYSKQPYTEYISTRWYRAPECLLTDGYYNYKMDMWGVGCVFFEIVSLFPLFPGTNELDQIQKIHSIIGTPDPALLNKMKQRSQHMDFNFTPKTGSGIAKLIPHCSSECIDLIEKLLAYNPDDRLSARQALRHPYFREIREIEKRQHALLNPREETILSPRGGKEDVRRHAGAPSAASVSATDASHRSRRARGSVPAAAAVGASKPRAGADDLPSIGGRGIAEHDEVGGRRAREHDDGRDRDRDRDRRRAGAPSHASSASSRSHAYAQSYHGAGAGSVSGSSMISAGGISVGGVSVGARGVAGKVSGSNRAGAGGAGVGAGAGAGSGGYGVVGKQARVSHLGAKEAGRGAIGVVGGHRAPVSKHRSSEARHHGEARRSEYVSPYGQRRG